MKTKTKTKSTIARRSFFSSMVAAAAGMVVIPNKEVCAAPAPEPEQPKKESSYGDCDSI